MRVIRRNRHPGPRSTSRRRARRRATRRAGKRRRSPTTRLRSGRAHRAHCDPLACLVTAVIFVHGFAQVPSHRTARGQGRLPPIRLRRPTTIRPGSCSSQPAISTPTITTRVAPGLTSQWSEAWHACRNCTPSPTMSIGSWQERRASSKVGFPHIACPWARQR